MNKCMNLSSFQPHDFALPSFSFLSLHSYLFIYHVALLLSLLSSISFFQTFSSLLIHASYDLAPSHSSIIPPSLSPFHYSSTSSIPSFASSLFLCPSFSSSLPFIPSIWKIVQQQHLSRRLISKEPQYWGQDRPPFILSLTHTLTENTLQPTIHDYSTTDLLHTHTVQGSTASKYSFSLSHSICCLSLSPSPTLCLSLFIFILMFFS